MIRINPPLLLLALALLVVGCGKKSKDSPQAVAPSRAAAPAPTPGSGDPETPPPVEPAPHDGPACQNLESPLTDPEAEEKEFFERVRERAVEIAELSRLEAHYIQFCFSEQEDPANLLYGWARADANVKQSIQLACEALRPKILAQAEHLDEYRLRLALTEAQMREDWESLHHWPPAKMNAKISPQFYDFSLKRAFTRTLTPLTGPERERAVRAYDDAFREASRKYYPDWNPEERTPFYMRPAGFDSRMKREIAEWRAGQEQEALALLVKYPLLAHLHTEKNDSAAIAAAAANVRVRATEALERLEAMRKKIANRDERAFDLFLIDGAVDQVLRESPSLCGTAARLKKKQEAIAAWNHKKQLAFAGTFGLGCFVLTKSPKICVGVGATLAAADSFFRVFPRHTFRIAALESALAADRSIVRSIHDLSSAEREVFVAGLMVIMPYEIVAAYPLEWSYLWIRPFRLVVDKISGETKLAGEEILKRILRGMRNAPLPAS